MPTDLPEDRAAYAHRSRRRRSDRPGRYVASRRPATARRPRRSARSEIATPVLEEPLEGRIYVAQPAVRRPGPVGMHGCRRSRRQPVRPLPGSGTASGVVVKLRGSVFGEPDDGPDHRAVPGKPAAARERSDAANLKGGARAPLANPRQCGQAHANGDLAPWSSPMTPDAIVARRLPGRLEGAGGPCPATLPFAPTLEAGSTNAGARAATARSRVTIARGDRQQDLARLQVKLPAGPAGDALQGAALRANRRPRKASARRRAKSAASRGRGRLGPAAAVGVRASVYLTGPYERRAVRAVDRGARRSRARSTSATSWCARASASIEDTSAITVTSDPLPQFLDGVPLRIQTLNIAVDREGFMFNPTNCAASRSRRRSNPTQGAAAKPSRRRSRWKAARTCRSSRRSRRPRRPRPPRRRVRAWT